MRVLLVEDDEALAKTIELTLAAEGIVCDISKYGEDGLEFSRSYNYDLIILDLMLPDINGYEVLHRIRKHVANVPVLILSGLGTSEEKVKGLSLGADDYLSKPFNRSELIARVKAIVRRSQGRPDSLIQIDDLQVDLEAGTTSVLGKIVRLTCKEQQLVEILASRRGKVVPKEILLSKLYGPIDEPEIKIIDVFVCKIRKKLSDASGGRGYIETSWGRGYLLDAATLHSST